METKQFTVGRGPVSLTHPLIATLAARLRPPGGLVFPAHIGARPQVPESYDPGMGSEPAAKKQAAGGELRAVPIAFVSSAGNKQVLAKEAMQAKLTGDTVRAQSYWSLPMVLCLCMPSFSDCGAPCQRTSTTRSWCG